MHPVDVKAKIGKSMRYTANQILNQLKIDRKQAENDDSTRHHVVFTNCIRDDIVNRQVADFIAVIGAVVAHLSGWKHKISAKFSPAF
jgi:hypothetical protein